MIARQLEEMWCRLGETDFTVLEYGQAMALCVRGILDHLQQTSPLYEKADLFNYGKKWLAKRMATNRCMAKSKMLQQCSRYSCIQWLHFIKRIDR